MNFNYVVTMFDENHNMKTLRAYVFDNGRCVNLEDGGTLIIETLEQFKDNCIERLTEGNYLTEKEKEIGGFDEN